MSTTTETLTVAAQGGKGDKKTKPALKKLITLRLAPTLLAQFAPPPLSRRASTIKSDPDSASTPNPPVNGDANQNGTPADNVSESASTPAPNGDLTNGDGSKKKGGPKGGIKRALADGIQKPRGRPGPKKKPRLDDGTVDSNVRTSFGGAVPLVAHKLGPKANQGAINAGLRALDRSGKPCRRWEKKAFMLKSFTGVAWELPTWRAPFRQETSNGDVNGVSQNGESEEKPHESSTGLESEKSNQGEAADPSQPAEPNTSTTPLPSSPVPTPPLPVTSVDA